MYKIQMQHSLRLTLILVVLFVFIPEILLAELVQGKDGVWRNTPQKPSTQQESTQDFNSEDRHKTFQMPDRETCILKLKESLGIIEQMSDVRMCVFKKDGGACEKDDGTYIVLKCTIDNVLNIIE